MMLRASTEAHRSPQEKEKTKMAISMKQSLMFSSCSLLMSFLFAYSAAVQLNDPDWYFWFPLYAFACGVNFLQVAFTSKVLSQVALLALWGGVLLLLKVLLEAHLHGLASLWSLDMSKRVVREKMGSGLVVISMSLHLKASQMSKEPIKRKREEVAKFLDSGMAALVAVSFGMSLYFFTYSMDRMNF